MNKNWVIAIQSIVIIILLWVIFQPKGVDSTPVSDTKKFEDSAAAHEAKIETIKPKLAAEENITGALKKKRKALSPYRKDLDTTAAKDTIFVAYKTADSNVTICDSLVESLEQTIVLEKQASAEKDTVIFIEKNEANALQNDLKIYQKAIKRERRKARVARLGGALAVAGSIILFINPVTGAIVVVAGGAILVISATK